MALGAITYPQDAMPRSERPLAQRPLRYGILADNSGSLRMQLESIIELVKDIVEENGPNDEAFLVRFISSDQISIIQDFTSAKGPIQDAAEEMYIEGGRASILDAINVAADHLKERSLSESGTSSSLLLITDGDEKESSARVDEVAAKLKQSNIRVFVVGVSDLKVNTKSLDRLVKGTDGKIFLPKGQDGRKAAAKDIVASMRAMQ